jgi:hypothetical protein
METIRRLFGLAFFGSGMLMFGFAFVYAGVMWIREILFYSQTGWNFDLPPPGLHGFIEPNMESNFNRLVYGWPLEMAQFGFFTLTFFSVFKLCLSPHAYSAASRAQSPGTRRTRMWIVVLALSSAFAALLFARHLASLEQP